MGQKHSKNCSFKLKFEIFFDFLIQEISLQYIDIKRIANLLGSNIAYLKGFARSREKIRVVSC